MYEFLLVGAGGQLSRDGRVAVGQKSDIVNLRIRYYVIQVVCIATIVIHPRLWLQSEKEERGKSGCVGQTKY